MDILKNNKYFIGIEEYKFEEESTLEQKQLEFFKYEISNLSTELYGEGYKLNNPIFEEGDSEEIKVSKVKSKLGEILSSIDNIK